MRLGIQWRECLQKCDLQAVRTNLQSRLKVSSDNNVKIEEKEDLEDTEVEFYKNESLASKRTSTQIPLTQQDSVHPTTNLISSKHSITLPSKPP
jgi:hypothetical protein